MKQFDNITLELLLYLETSISIKTILMFQTVKSTYDCIKTQLCTIAISLTLFNSTRLPREAFRYGAVPYLVVYSFWLLVVGLPVVLLQLAMGQLSQQDSVGVWRAVPILRGKYGHHDYYLVWCPGEELDGSAVSALGVRSRKPSHSGRSWDG
jgi:hypothetical protein